MTAARAAHTATLLPNGKVLIAGGYQHVGPELVLASAELYSDGLFGAQLAGTTVQINGTPAPLVYTSASQVAAVIPHSVFDSMAQVTVTYQGQTSPSFAIPVAPTARGSSLKMLRDGATPSPSIKMVRLTPPLTEKAT